MAGIATSLVCLLPPWFTLVFFGLESQLLDRLCGGEGAELCAGLAWVFGSVILDTPLCPVVLFLG